MPQSTREEAPEQTFCLRGHDELISENPILADAEKTLSALREKKGEIKAVLTPEVQEKGIYANPEIFSLFEFIRAQNVEPGELGFLLSQFSRNVELPYGTKLLIGGSGWGITGRSLAGLRPDLKITHADINPDIVNMDWLTNQNLGFQQIENVVADVTNRESLIKLMEDHPQDVATVGLMRYLTPKQQETMVDNLLDVAKPNTKFLMREINPRAMAHVMDILKDRGVDCQHESKEVEHLRYTGIFAYYYMYKQEEPMFSAIKEINPDFDFQSFKETVDKLKENYPQIDTTKIFGSDFDLGDLRHLLVLADLAGHDMKQEEIIIFHN